jgi:hypothetical protein
MDLSDLYRTVFSRLEHLSYQQLALLTAVIVGFGVYCLRGFGSRSNY